VWDLATDAVLHTLTGHQNTVWTVAVTSDDTRVVTTSVDGTAIAWDLASGARYRSLTGYQRPIQAVAITSDSSWAITASDDGTAAQWDLGTGARTAVWHGDHSMLAAACAPKVPIFTIGDYRSGVSILRLNVMA
jgi:WD40 repeat protein